MKYRCKIDFNIVMMEVVFTILLLVGIYYQIQIASETWQKAGGIIFYLSIFYFQLAYALLFIEFDEKKLVISRPIHWKRKIQIDLLEVNEIIINDMGKMLYLRVIFNDKRTKRIDCSSISRYDLDCMAKKFNEIGISACSHFGL